LAHGVWYAIYSSHRGYLHESDLSLSLYQLNPVCQALDFLMENKNAMNKKNTLDAINSDDHVNETISRDEDRPLTDSSVALQMAEDLILQLPESHGGRTEWLRRFGHSDAAKALKASA
jgi:hypothetical protein